ncbi:hypothetical protein JQK87_28080, partial [Streptomyces sp. G44]|nr:hypothetical protein [Streptomyces sp. G44]
SQPELPAPRPGTPAEPPYDEPGDEPGNQRHPEPRPRPRPEPEPEPQPEPQPDPQPEVLPHESPWFAKHPASYAPEEPYDQWYEEQAPYDNGQHDNGQHDDGQRDDGQRDNARYESEAEPEAQSHPAPAPAPEPEPDIPGLPDDVSRVEAYFTAFRKYVSEIGDYPNARQFSLYLMDLYGVTGQAGGPLTESTLRPYLRDFRSRHQRSLDAGADTDADADARAEHIA